MNISLGPLTFHMYGLIIGVAILLGWYLAKKRAYLSKIPKNFFDDPILLIPLVLGIIGARLYHVVHYWSYYKTDPSQVLAITNGGLGIWGGLAGIFIGCSILAKIRRINLLSLLDLITPSLLLAQAIGRIGNFINQEGFGPPTNLPWGVLIDPKNRPSQFLNDSYFHPTFFYEAALDLMFLTVLLKVTTKLKIGQTFALYLIFYSLGRFIVEFWRIDTWTTGTIKMAHLLSVLTFVLGIWFFLIKSSKPLTINH